MGQAKQRGTREERLAQRLGLVERSLNELKRDLNIPDDAEFLGYGVHREESDEFLSGFKEHVGVKSMMWVKTPEMAKTFLEFSSAYDTSRKCTGSVVVGIFDSEKQMWVAIAQN